MAKNKAIFFCSSCCFAQEAHTSDSTQCTLCCGLAELEPTECDERRVPGLLSVLLYSHATLHIGCVDGSGPCLSFLLSF